MTPEQFSAVCRLNTEEFSALKEILNDPELTAWAKIIAEQCFIPEKYGEMPELPEGNSLSKAWFAAAFFGADSAAEHFRKKGFPEAILHETMTDITAWLRNTKRNNGVIGIGYGRSWEVILFHGDVTRHGRLECNTSSLFKGRLLDEHGTALLQDGEPVIQLHIPEDGPMDMESCGNSMKRMAAFFARYFPDYEWKGFYCESWLLDPQLLPMLPDHSNILKFNLLGYTYPLDIKTDTQFRVFGTTPPDSIENPTSLQQKAAAFLRTGGIFKEGGLFLPREMIEKVGYDLEKLVQENRSYPLKAVFKENKDVV